MSFKGAVVLASVQSQEGSEKYGPLTFLVLKEGDEALVEAMLQFSLILNEKINYFCHFFLNYLVLALFLNSFWPLLYESTFITFFPGVNQNNMTPTQHWCHLFR